MLKDPAWQGIAGIAAIAALLLALLDRNRAPSDYLVRSFFGMLGFGLIGALYGVPAMLALGLIGEALNYLGYPMIPGFFGRKLASLSNVQLWQWGFNPSASILSRQLGAFGLWVGSLVSGLLFSYIGIATEFNIGRLNRFHLYFAFSVLMLIAFIGIVNLISSV